MSQIRDKATREVHEIAEREHIETVFERYKAQQPQCGFGLLGLCCRICNLGPCRVDPFGEGPQQGACGADADVIAARNLVRAIAVGAACHSDHARDLVRTLLLLAKGQAPAYEIRAPEKLKRVAAEFGIRIEGRDLKEIAGEFAQKAWAEFGQQEGRLTFMRRAPKKQQDMWNNQNISPRGIDREVVEAINRTHEGMDADYKSLIAAGMRTALADGWGGSMLATEISDVLFGAPQAIRAKVNLGVIKEDEVNILVHGHEPTLSDVIVTASQLPEMLKFAKEHGAAGINIAGICCTANEILVRRGIPVAGNFLQQELALVTGAVEALLVDVQCIMPGLVDVARNFHTKVISTNPKAHFIGIEHIEFKEEEALEIARRIIKIAIENYKNRDRTKVNIPKEEMDLIAGFTTENVFYYLGGTYRSSYRPLNDNIINGRIRGVAGVVGCDNPRNASGQTHVDMVKELIKNDVLVVQTGCAAIACAKAGLLTPESALEYAGKGLKEVCAAVGIPPVLHNGACVDNSRILIECCEMVREGGIGHGLDELPVAGAAMEWMAEKAIAIGWYCVASGIFIVFGSPMQVMGSANLTRYITEELADITGGKWVFESDPIKSAHLMIEHIEEKRKKLKI